MSSFDSLFGSSNEGTTNNMFSSENMKKFTLEAKPVELKSVIPAQKRIESKEKAKILKAELISQDARLSEKREKRKLRNMKSSEDLEGDRPTKQAKLEETSNKVKINGPVTEKKSEVVQKPTPVQVKNNKKEKKDKKQKVVESNEEDKMDIDEDSEVKVEAETEGKIEEVEKKEKIVDPNLSRTLFVGNVPISLNQKKLEVLFTQFGKIKSIRLRSIPIAGVKVDDAGNQDLVKKVCANQKKFGDQKASFNAYIVYEEEESVQKALKMNNFLYEGRHLRVDTATPTLFDTKRTIFIGGLPYYADEEEVRKHFADVLDNGDDDIEGIRLIRDQESLIGKGIAYITFKTRDSVLKALNLDGKPYKKRWNLRVTSCGKRTKKADGKANTKNIRDKINNVPALKRIKLKKVTTKKKLLNNRKNKSKPNKKK